MYRNSVHLLLLITFSFTVSTGCQALSSPDFGMQPTITATAAEPVPDEGQESDTAPPVTNTPAPSVTILPSATTAPSTSTALPELTSSATPEMKPTPTPISADADPSESGQALIADHTVVGQFYQIPDEYIEAAGQLSMLFRHASVGFNISSGLDCLQNNFDGRRPNGCDRELSQEQIFYDSKYDRSNWTFEFHDAYSTEFSDPGVGWWNKVYLFEDRLNGVIGPGESYDVAGFKFGYVDTSEGANYDIDDVFFANDPDDNLPSIENLEQLEGAYPQITFMYWTMALSRRADLSSQNFNRQMREYATANGKVLMDLADIQSHRPDGTPCYDNLGNNNEAICDEYTEDVGHLNALGKQRVAMALWWLTARIAGWDEN